MMLVGALVLPKNALAFDCDDSEVGASAIRSTEAPGQMIVVVHPYMM
jgi:hypothetical protein